MLVVDGLISAMGPGLAGEGALPGEGLFLAPAFIDSHVHLAYLPQSAEMAAGGVAAAVELDLLVQAGLSPVEVMAAGTTIPAAVWGLDDLGAIEVGKAASFLLLAEDPRDDVGAWGAPVGVWLAGGERTGRRGGDRSNESEPDRRGTE